MVPGKTKTCSSRVSATAATGQVRAGTDLSVMLYRANQRAL